ncbi:MAG: glycoside hydrolase family 78 protein [Treponemataceae bacterium]|nr:glycoside hydrolase family 78 protein [Treponemataceae bacterium]
MKAAHIQIEHLSEPLGIDCNTPLVTWICDGDIKQTAYELKAFVSGSQVYDSGKVPGSAMAARIPHTAKSRQRVTVELTLWNEHDEAGPAVTSWYEMGLNDTCLWKAEWISPELECDPEVHKPASYLRKTFTVDSPDAARLYITCHGLYEAYLNGKRVGNVVLAPGSYTYDKRLAYQTYVVTDLLHTGENTLEVILGDGWFRGVSGVDGDRNLYGTHVALLCQLEVAGMPVCVSDETWQASQNGPVRENDMQQGESVDLRIDSASGYHGVRKLDLGYDTLICSQAVTVTEHERFPGKLLTTPNGETVIDFGQNLAGYIEVEVEAHEGQIITLMAGETLDENGNFTQENFQDRKRHKEGGTRQMLTVTCREGKNWYKPRFTIWGFRYAKVTTDIDLSTARFTSIAVYSDMAETLRFHSANPDLQQLVQNALWSMKSNFCDVPTDCPTRERAAWTGDMGVFIETGLTMMDCYTVVRKWLAECRLAQYEDGKIANIAPRNNKPSFFSGLLAGSVGWGDAIIQVPYAMYKRYDDATILEENYDMMKKWYSYLESRAKSKPVNPLKRFKSMPNRDYIIETGIDYGEWCEPDVESTNAMRTPQGKVATAYFAHSGTLLADIAGILGKTEDQQYYRQVAEKAKEGYRFIATDNGVINSDRQAEYIRAITFDLLSEAEKKVAAASLNTLVINCGYHLNTGFLSTPDVCKVLTDYGYADTAVKLLLQDTMPGWLYSVKKGATTIWESWNGIDEHSVPHESLNHYSKGAVAGWLVSGVCGIHFCNGKIRISPALLKELGDISASYDSPCGTIAVSITYLSDTATITVTVPSNTEAELMLPGVEPQTLTAGTKEITVHC